MADKTIVIALTGKGGVGKTSLSASIVRILTEEKPDARILAIDADPAVGLSTALGVEVKETLDDIRRRVAEDVTGKVRATEDVLAEAKFRLFEAMEEQHGFAFLAIGRPEAAGCYCAINTYLKQVIEMLVGDFDYVVIDGEAGIEQINRRVMEKVTHLLCVSDQSRRGLSIINTIRNVADELVMYEKAGVVINRAPMPERISGETVPGVIFPDGDGRSAAKTKDGIPLVAVIPPDTELTEVDVDGRSVFDLPKDAMILRGAREALANLCVL